MHSLVQVCDLDFLFRKSPTFCPQDTFHAHLLFTHSLSKFLEYKNYKLKWEKRNKLKADTLTNIKQKNTDLKFFERILKKYGY